MYCCFDLIVNSTIYIYTSLHFLLFIYFWFVNKLITESQLINEIDKDNSKKQFTEIDKDSS